MTTIDEFYKVGPGPSSSHTIGPMRITYDFYQRATKLPADQLAKATALKVHLYGSLSATGKGHGTERAALAGIIGKEPATINPLFLDEMAAKPDQTFPVKLGSATFNASLKDIIYDAPKGDFPHPNTMTCKLMAGDTVLLEQEYYSVGGGFIEWKGYTPPKKGAAEVPVLDDEGTAGARDEEQAHLRADSRWRTKSRCPARPRRRSTRSSTRSRRRWSTSSSPGLPRRPATLPGPIKLKTKAGDVHKRAMDDKYAGAARRRYRRGVCAGGFGGERARPPGRHGSDGRIGRRDAGAGLRARRRRPQTAASEDPRRASGRRRDRLPLQAQRHAGGLRKVVARRRLAWRPRWARRSSRRRTTSTIR